MNNNLNFALYNSFLAIRTSPLQRKYKFKGCASYFGPCSSRKNPFALLVGSLCMQEGFRFFKNVSLHQG